MHFTILYNKEDYEQAEKLYLRSTTKWWQAWFVLYFNFKLLFNFITKKWLKVNPYVSVTFDITQEGIGSTSPEAPRKHWVWSEFTDYRVNENYLIMYHYPKQQAMLIFPKRVFEEREWQELLHITKQHLQTI